ncbi:hypothetical protein K431DRAFT_291471 [Polychaeton citri CBS 116435]|uniref:YTH domain-containing protein n=1 Tax=Polychaeton citri CBS 116435 TaxID=1314669 RepID=A0A9P4QFS5_9PEZI|nr:hypothetical protein K431DRAFT_291471 [Polychaeton citri CBS 116435]
MEREECAGAFDHHTDSKSDSELSNMAPARKYPLNRQRRVNGGIDESRIVPKPMQRFFHKLINERAANAESDTNSDRSGAATHADSLSLISSGVTSTPSQRSLIEGRTRPERWSEQFSVQDFKRTIGLEQFNLRERYQGALNTVASLNPPSFTLADGSALICIKTETEQNFIWSVRHNKWGNNKKVNDRVQQAWNEKNDREKIYFLFSVNGSSQYCGLAEMVGSIQRDAELDGWEQNHEGAPTEGHIEQPRNGHSIADMWCGMHFPHEIARDVVKTYIETPHCENYLIEVLGPEDDVTSSGPQQGHPTAELSRSGHESIYRGRGSSREARGGARPSESTRTDMALATRSWRRQGEDPALPQHSISDGGSNDSAHRHSTLVSHLADKRALTCDAKINDTKSDAETLRTSDQLRNGIVLATYDGDGTLRPYKPDNRAHNRPIPETGFPQLDGHSLSIDNSSYSRTMPGHLSEHGGVALSSKACEGTDHGSQRSKVGQCIHSSLRGTGWLQLQDVRQASPSTVLNTLTRSDWAHGPLSSDDVFSTPSRLELERLPQSAPPRPMRMTLPTPQHKSSPRTPSGKFRESVHGIYPLTADTTPQSSTEQTASGKVPMPPDTSKLADLFLVARPELKPLAPPSKPPAEHGAVIDGRNISKDVAATPQRSHRARGSEFSRSFDARVKSDLSNIVDSPDYSSYTRRGRVFTPESSPDTSAEEMSRCLKDLMSTVVGADAKSLHASPSSPNCTFVSQ